MMFSIKEKDLKYVLPLDGMKIKDNGNASPASRRNSILLFNSEGRNVSKVNIEI